ncbi:hypothetical protein SAMD00019534_106270 [Acytostelium subglobosum LB1]|uniref:hypothetical protein n=1 Tax=Acytostelium subglobosum LB1 TaxID=1410327 RepID=UPI0006452014|nr:hypothetical protein SAMD00019534_106270 [Acytostelium subglobosum LB1]GAM27451.1 hypothetical protein SAMD00019534_106270 [Acytostelium subglobosum LB1]|eukprot:XP_012749516.1 hypothetical protein SAMD00019534_106270 [Acytostelium subglobosum LB1]
MVKKTVIITIAVVVALIVVAAIVIPTTIILTRNNGEPGPSGPAYTIKNLNFAQTHVIPAQGRKWTTPNNSTNELHLVGERDTLVLVEFEDVIEPTYRPRLQVWLPTANNQSIYDLATTIDLNLPSELPRTESNGTLFANNTYSVRLPAKYVLPRMQVSFKNNNHNSTELVPVKVGFSSYAILWNIPFYYFGANETNSEKFDDVKSEAKNTAFIYQQWPVSRLTVANHPIGKIEFKTFVQHPKNSDAKIVHNLNEVADGDTFRLMGSTLGILSKILNANGDGDQNKLIWGPIMALNNRTKYSGLGGGLAVLGGKVGTGDVSNGVMIHEIGHSQNLAHAGEAYNDGSYPYVRGSLNGSAWGFNMDTNEFLSNYIPSNSSDYKNCNTSAIMDNGRCVRQDPMQGGSGDQSKGNPYTMFADFYAARIQRFYEGTTSVTKDGAHSISSLWTWVPETKSYVQWDSIDLKNVPCVLVNNSNALYEFDMGTPALRDVPVYTVIIQYISGVGSSCTNCNIVYPLIKWTGNLLRHIDPTDPAQIKQITPNSGALAWFCHVSGCDYTIRVTYKDGSKYVKLLQTGVRDWFSPKGPALPEYFDPKDSSSTMTFLENIPGNQQPSLIELLWTPYGFNSTTPADAQVLVSQSY